ncbi:MAG: DUF58 domain-containing protein [Chloroflexi bacterium]|nr:DUF58 domain-containing protein [Chloroflexota bacterium]
MRKRRTVVFILALLALLGGLITGRDILFTVTYLLGLLLVLSFFWAWANINWTHISRVTRVRRTQVGKPLEERFAVRNTSRIPKLWLEVRDFSEVPAHITSQVVTALGAKASYIWRTTTICQQRGRYRLGPITLSSSDPFGLFPMTRNLISISHVVVYPMTVDIYQFVIPTGVLPGGDALRRRTHYVTTNASGVREYAPGDSFNRIHWKSTARRGRLIVKEYELDPMADIWIVPDMSRMEQIVRRRPLNESTSTGAHLAPGWSVQKEEIKIPETTEEYIVTIAASLAQFFLRQDRAVGMLTYGQSNEIVQPDRGERQMNRILETMAVLRAEGTIPVPDVLNAEINLLPRGTTVIVVTCTTDEKWVISARELKRRGMRVVTVLVDPATFGGTQTNKGLSRLLQASGVMTYDVNNGDNLTVALSKAKIDSSFAYA